MELTVRGETAFAATGGKGFDAGLPTLVFIHGASFDRTVWRLQARYFAWHGYSVLAVDLPGHGRSGGAALTSISAMAAWLHEFLDAAGIVRAAFVGHSMGAFVALESAALRPERAFALTMVCIAYPMPVGEALIKPARENDHVAMERLTSWGYGKSAEIGGSRTPGLWMTGVALRILEHSAPDLLYHDLNACNDYDGGEAAAAAVTCPTQFLLAEKDLMTPLKRGLSFAKTFNHLVIDVVPGAGHILIDEHPDQSLDALIRFFRQAVAV